MRLVVNAAAEADLEDISVYSIRTWGMDQAEIYAGGLLEHLDRLAEQPTGGAAVENSRYRRSRYRSHAVYFRVEGSSLIVARILHLRMDPARHLA